MHVQNLVRYICLNGSQPMQAVQAITAAYNVLSKDEERERYDAIWNTAYFNGVSSHGRNGEA